MGEGAMGGPYSRLLPVTTTPRTTTTRSYQMECRSCLGEGELLDSYSLKRPCKACRGTGVVWVAETTTTSSYG